MVCCPTCGSEMTAAHAPLESLAGAPLSRRERQIVEALSRAYPRSLEIGQVIDLIYSSDPNGGPDGPGNVIAQTISRLRRRLPAYGWTIPISKTGQGNFARYRLAPISKAGQAA